MGGSAPFARLCRGQGSACPRDILAKEKAAFFLVEISPPEAPALASGARRRKCGCMSDTTSDPRLRLRVVFGDGAMIGPGKADLLALIRETGSI